MTAHAISFGDPVGLEALVQAGQHRGGRRRGSSHDCNVPSSCVRRGRKQAIRPQYAKPLLGILRSYWRLARRPLFLFPGRTPDKPIVPSVLHAACRSAAAEPGWTSALAFMSCAMLRDASLGGRRRHPHHPSVARPREPLDDSALYARFDPGHRQHRKPAGQAVVADDAAGIGGDVRGRRSNWPTSFAAMARPTNKRAPDTSHGSSGA